MRNVGGLGSLGWRGNVGGLGSLGYQGPIVAEWAMGFQDVGGSLRDGAPVAPPAHAGAGALVVAHWG